MKPVLGHMLLQWAAKSVEHWMEFFNAFCVDHVVAYVDLDGTVAAAAWELQVQSHFGLANNATHVKFLTKRCWFFVNVFIVLLVMFFLLPGCFMTMLSSRCKTPSARMHTKGKMSLRV